MELVAANWPLAPGQSLGMYAQCPGGKRAIGGGWFGPGTNEVIISRMEPSNTVYNVIAKNIVGYETIVRVTVVCAAVN